MNIGQKFLIINEVPYNAFSGHSRDPTKYVILEVISAHDDAEGEFNGEVGTGYIAKGSDGYFYGYNYPFINQGLGTTPWTRYISDEDFVKLSEKEKNDIVEDYIWNDIVHYQCPAEAKFAKPLDFISYCDVHQHHYYVENGCKYCTHFKEFRHKVTMNMKEHAWQGWY